MSTPPRNIRPTLVGLPVFVPEEPFPLTPYREVLIYTPSRERPVPGGERTPVILPPPSPAARKLDPTLHIRRTRSGEPSRPSQWLAAALVCGVVALAVALL